MDCGARRPGSFVGQCRGVEHHDRGYQHGSRHDHSALAAKSPLTYNIVTGSTTVHDSVGHGTFVASLAAGAYADPTGMTGFGGNAHLMIVQANRSGANFTDIDEAGASPGPSTTTRTSSTSASAALRPPTSSAPQSTTRHPTTCSSSPRPATPRNKATRRRIRQHCSARTGSSWVPRLPTAPAPRSRPPVTTSICSLPASMSWALSPQGSRSGFFSPIATPGATGSYGVGSGTSYAAPEVAGAAALVWAANPSLSAAGVAATIEATASSQGRWTPDLAFGNLNVAAAVAVAAGGPAPADRRTAGGRQAGDGEEDQDPRDHRRRRRRSPGARGTNSALRLEKVSDTSGVRRQCRWEMLCPTSGFRSHLLIARAGRRGSHAIAGSRTPRTRFAL